MPITADFQSQAALEIHLHNKNKPHKENKDSLRIVLKRNSNFLPMHFLKLLLFISDFLASSSRLQIIVSVDNLDSLEISAN